MEKVAIIDQDLLDEELEPEDFDKISEHIRDHHRTPISLNIIIRFLEKQRRVEKEERG